MKVFQSLCDTEQLPHVRKTYQGLWGRHSNKNSAPETVEMHGDSRSCTEQCCRFSPSRKQGQAGRSCPRHETVGHFRGLAASTSVPVSKESVNFVREQTTNGDDVLTSFNIFSS